MTRVSPLFRFMPYGAPELLDAGRPNMARALVLASLAGALAFALLGLLRLAQPAVVSIPLPMPMVEILPEPDFEILRLREPSGATIGRIAPNTGNAIDEVVPDLPTTAQTIEFDPSATGIPGAPTDVTGGEVILDNNGAPAETLPERGVFVTADVMPEALREVEPPYPPMAYELGLSGLVIVHMLVGRNGRVLQAVVDERTNDVVFNEASLAAARQFVFRPASHNGRTVAVWVTVPFRYTFIAR